MMIIASVSSAAITRKVSERVMRFLRWKIRSHSRVITKESAYPASDFRVSLEYLKAYTSQHYSISDYDGCAGKVCASHPDGISPSATLAAVSVFESHKGYFNGVNGLQSGGWIFKCC
jgi:hypothetical protein